MVVFLINIIFFALSTLLNLVSRLIFGAAAHGVVLLIRGFKLPGEAIQGVLERVGNLIRACIEFLVELVVEAISNIISSLFDLVKESILVSAVATGSVVGGLMDNARTSLDGLLENFPELIEGFTEMISRIISNLWDNYKDAVGYVTENI